MLPGVILAPSHNRVSGAFALFQEANSTSLAQGVPQVAIPVSFDQPGIAARIAHHKTGLVASLDKLNTVNLSTLVGEVLSDATYRDNARRIQKAIIKANGLSVAADLVESLGMTVAGKT
jgi:UDP:flavonoid glycosyltransferase YjiC (YdhE family)